MSDCLRFFAGAARNLEGKSAGEYVEGYTSIIRREPLGIVAGICPWNYPLYMAIWKICPALAAGNVQIIKPAEQTPLTLLRFCELAQEIIPPGVLQVVTGDGIPAGDALVRHPTSASSRSRATRRPGRPSRRTPPTRSSALHLELGGKAPMVVLDDADPAAVAEAVEARRLLQLGPGLHGLLADPRLEVDLRRRPIAGREGGRRHERRRPAR